MEADAHSPGEATVADLVAEYEKVLDFGQQNEFSEHDVSTKFALPLIQALGWDIRRIDEVKEQKRTLTGPVDYSLNLNGRPKIVVELKRLSESLDGKRVVRGKDETYAEQALRYGFHLRTDWVVLTNFGELRLYFTGQTKPADALVFKLKFEDYLPRFKELWLLSRDSAASGQLDSYSKRRERHDIDDEILSDLLEIRTDFSYNIARSNRELKLPQVREYVQKIMDRLMVGRVAEDRGMIGADSIWKELEAWRNRGLPTPFMRSLKGLFRDFDEIYNSKLFNPHPCEDLAVDNKVLEQAITKLYEYNFELINADVLGSIYEDYLGHTLKEWENTVRLEESKEVRKKAGAFYTPTRIVDFMVRNTLGRKLATMSSAEEVMKLTILDPACGSGSFLIKAFDAIREWYSDYHQRVTTGQSALEHHFDRIANEERAIIQKNIFGVDFDEQAAEVASVNLMLKAIRRGEKLPLILTENIRVGNSLLDCPDGTAEKYFGSEWREKKPFRWKDEFPQILNRGGFDVIIGNPPYVDIYTIPEKDRRYFTDSGDFLTAYKKFDLYSLFVEKALTILHEEGTMSFIVPDKVKSAPYAEKLRKYILDHCVIDLLVDFGKIKVFPHSSVRNVILVLTKTENGERRDNNSIEVRLVTQLEPELKWRTERMPQRLFLESPGFEWRLELIESSVRHLVSKIESGSVLLGEICYVNWGLRTGTNEKTKRMIVKEHNDPRCRPLVRGDNIRGKYSISYEGDYIVYDTSRDGLFNPMFPEFFENPKILIRKISGQRGLFATLDTSGKYCFSTIIGCLPYYSVKDSARVRASSDEIQNSREFDIRFILGVFNSSLMDFYYRKQIGDELSVVPSHVKRLPIHPASPEAQQEISGLVEQILRLQASLDAIEDADFLTLVERHNALQAKERVRFITLRKFAKQLSLSEIHLGPSEYAPTHEKASSVKSRAKVRSLLVREKGDWLEFEASLKLEEGENRQVIPLSLRIVDPILRSYVRIAIPAFNDMPLSGPDLARKVMSCKVASLDRDSIYRVVREYQNAKSKREHLRSTIDNLRAEVDTHVFRLYDFSSEEATKIKNDSVQLQDETLTTALIDSLHRTPSQFSGL